MFPINDKDRQGELFSDLANLTKKRKDKKHGLGRIILSLSYENIIILSIGLIMFLIACYTLGVEKGRQLAQHKSDEITQEQVQKQPDRVAPKPTKKKEKIEVAQLEQPPKASPYIQVASFRTTKYAQKEVARLEDKGYQPYLATWGKYKVVCVGGYKSDAEAKVSLKQLKKLYTDCILHDE